MGCIKRFFQQQVIHLYSLIFDSDITPADTIVIAAKHNLEIKLQPKHKLGYYSGHFVCKVNNVWTITKDFIKKIDSLALPIDKTLVIEHYISMLDWIKTLDPSIESELVPLIYQRFRNDADGFISYIRKILTMADHFMDFHQLTNEEKWRLLFRYKMVKTPSP